MQGGAGIKDCLHCLKTDQKDSELSCNLKQAVHAGKNQANCFYEQKIDKSAVRQRAARLILQVGFASFSSGTFTMVHLGHTCPASFTEISQKLHC